VKRSTQLALLQARNLLLTPSGFIAGLLSLGVLLAVWFEARELLLRH